MAPPEGLPKMEYRFLGRSGLKVSAISLGGWLTYGGHVENDNTFACMKAAYDVGINFFDCAEGYSSGESERVMGQAIKKFAWKRNDLVISTKIYWGGANGENPVNNVGLSRKHIVEGVNASLERLGLEYVDLIYAHRPDRNTPIEETVRAFNHIIDTGKAFYWGTSEWSAEELATAWRYADKLGLIGPLMEQPQYNMLAREKVEKEYERLYEEVGLGLTIWSPLKVGLLTGKYNDGIPADSRLGTSQDPIIKNMNKNYEAGSWKKDIETVKQLKPIADKLGITQANLAYAWVLKNKNVSSAITGASRPEQVYESVKALDAVEKLTPEILKEIDDILGNKPAATIRRFG
ncbi:putative voltage-gated K channel beta subunit [Bisporella sp. PMI_857]|nr:putative voltage-gated K channel beta subunit [Bisporella sp. PMI_857]